MKHKKLLVLGSVAILSSAVALGTSKWTFGGSSTHSVGGVNVKDRTFDGIKAKTSYISLSGSKSCAHSSVSGYSGKHLINYFTVQVNGSGLTQSEITSALNNGTLKVTTTGNFYVSSGYLYMNSTSGTVSSSVTLSFVNDTTIKSTINGVTKITEGSWYKAYHIGDVGNYCTGTLEESYLCGSSNLTFTYGSNFNVKCGYCGCTWYGECSKTAGHLWYCSKWHYLSWGGRR